MNVYVRIMTTCVNCCLQLLAKAYGLDTGVTDVERGAAFAAGLGVIGAIAWFLIGSGEQEE